MCGSWVICLCHSSKFVGALKLKSLILCQYQRRQRHSGLQKRQGSCPVTCNNFTVAAIMEKANAIRQEIMNSDEDEEENKDLK
jgi:hypothetical protein